MNWNMDLLSVQIFSQLPAAWHWMISPIVLVIFLFFFKKFEKVLKILEKRAYLMAFSMNDSSTPETLLHVRRIAKLQYEIQLVFFACYQIIHIHHPSNFSFSTYLAALYILRLRRPVCHLVSSPVRCALPFFSRPPYITFYLRHQFHVQMLKLSWPAWHGFIRLIKYENLRDYVLKKPWLPTYFLRRRAYILLKRLEKC